MTARSRDPGTPAEGFALRSAPNPSHDRAAAGTPVPAGTVVLILAGAVDRQWAAQAAVELTTAWARSGRRIVLADLHLENPHLHDVLGMPNLEGISDIFLYGASLSRIARPVEDGSFYLISAGTYAPDPTEIYVNPRWQKLVAGFRDTGAVLVLFAQADTADLGALSEWASQAIVLGPAADATMARSLGRYGIDVAAVIEPPVLAAAAPGTLPGASSVLPPMPGPLHVAGSAPPPQAPPAQPGRASPTAQPRPAPAAKAAGPSGRTSAVHRLPETDLELPPPPRRAGEPRRGTSILLWLFLALVILAAAGYLVATLRPDLLPGELRPPPVQEDPIPAADAPASAPSRLGDMLPYSVLVRAFTSLEAAQEEAALERQRLGAVPVFISPEEIQGILYYKILAGLSTDTLAATRVRERLVETGSIQAEDASASWSLLQFAPLAFDLGEFPSEQEAAAWADSLLLRQVPAYPVVVPYSDGSRRWQLFGGAYRDSVSAARMREMVVAAGLTPHLTARIGLPATGSE